MPTQPKSIPEVATELKELTVAYAKQETIDPLRNMGRYVGFGIGGSLLIAVGVGIIALAALRALQTETGTALTGSLTALPYLIVAVGLLVVMALCIFTVKKDANRATAKDAAR